jgi:hypothetical protein
MKTWLIGHGWLLALLLASMISSGATAQHAQEQDKLLDTVQARLTSATVTWGEFRQIRELAHLKKPLVGSGSFIVARDKGVIWENRTPFAQTTRITPHEILQTSGQETLMRLSADKEPVAGIVSSLLFSALSGDFTALARYFAVSGQATANKWRLDFTPKDTALARLIHQLSITGARDIETVVIQSRAGDITTITFQAQRHADRLDAETQKRFAP